MNDMRHLINLVEGRDAPLYHNLRLGTEKAKTVFLNDTLPAEWVHDIPNLGKKTGISFTRNPRLQWGSLRLQFDQRKIAYTHKIIPLDGEYVHHGGQYADRQKTKKNDLSTLAEEFVIGDIKPLHKYLIDIKVTYPEQEDPAKIKQVLLPILDYAYKWGVPVLMPETLVMQKNILAPTVKMHSPSLFSDSELQKRYPNGIDIKFF